jgi:hypothetical protein
MLESDRLYLSYYDQALELKERGYVNDGISVEVLTNRLLKERKRKISDGTLHQPLFVPIDSVPVDY